VAVKVDTKAFQVGEKKRTPEKYSVEKDETIAKEEEVEKMKKKGKGRNIWAY
jgi:hypothetical protein